MTTRTPALALALALATLTALGCNTGSRSRASTASGASQPAGGGATPAAPSSSTPAAPAPPPPSGASPYDPPWSTLQPVNTITLDRDPALTAAQNGAALAQAMQALQPGDRLEIGAGTWSIESYFDLVVQGTPSAPIWIAAQAGATPVITRSNANQNVVNVGAGGPVRYLALQGLEITGGSMGLRLYDCSHVWVDRCHIHDVGDVPLTANTADTDHLYITRNEVHGTGGTGEGMYLGANQGQFVMRDSIVALNHVYDCGGSQGDGIEVKQGSYGNWIVENHVHDTQYPCIIAYGTNGNPPNVIEKNVCYRSGDAVLQVQGEAIVRNNLLIDGATGVQSHDHQGQTRDLVFVHNTVVTTGRGVNLVSWNNRPGMILANNVIYSQTAEAVRFPNGSMGVTVAGNVVLGAVSGYSGGGLTPGSGLTDFQDLAWDATRRDARPTPSSPPLGAGDPTHAVQDDLTGAARQGALEAGCVDAP